MTTTRIQNCYIHTVMENTENGSADNGNENEEAGESEVTDYWTDNSEL